MERVSVISGGEDKSPPAGISPPFSSFDCCFPVYFFLQRHYVQGGYSINLAPTKLMGKLRTFIDTTAHRVVGGLPPPVPSTGPGFAQLNEQALQPGNPNVPNSQSTMVMSSLMPSASMEPISERISESNQLNMPNRSISEPDFGKSPSKVDSYFLASSVLFSFFFFNTLNILSIDLLK